MRRSHLHKRDSQLLPVWRCLLPGLRPRALVTLTLAFLIAGCAALTQSVISVGGAGAGDGASLARIAIDPDRPVLLRAVDQKMLPGVQVSSRVRAFTYELPAGSHVLWVSSTPYGLPFIPQRLRCYVMQVTLSPGADYDLRFDRASQKPVLSHAASSEPAVEGVLVDEPLVTERACRWQ